MLGWLRRLLGSDQAAQERREQQRRGRQRSRQMRARDRELRKGPGGSKTKSTFFWGSPGVSEPVHQKQLFRE
ncbi:hypothetical protein POX_c03589 [Penicillium oxalicum]|uniref:Uncharacterized protein n=1 Tax=Penicillium oxalicum (strain 114-2 / CGMCC 5302) TaxID=933388 RepID=S8ATN3_PENO1|nr:hypothetical protein POX_c03589 [Penicillium oxalicum]EPS25187.1 hypothetical protein PDE_00119 [Penicillium oxalicum 114-2]KAI2790740.1 hypothetical protein POX_c03589 [Penicillium oxalicum]